MHTFKVSISATLVSTPAVLAAISVNWVSSVRRFVAKPSVFKAIESALVDIPSVFVEIEVSCACWPPWNKKWYNRWYKRKNIVSVFNTILY